MGKQSKRKFSVKDAAKARKAGDKMKRDLDAAAAKALGVDHRLPVPWWRRIFGGGR